MSKRKLQFQQEWLEDNWAKFVAEGVEDPSGRLFTVSDALLYLSKLEGEQIDAAFRLGPQVTHEAIEIIAKAFLLDTVVDELWGYHLAAEEEMGREMLWARAELAFENHDLKESAR
jgi:hypothetical protein